MKIFKFSIIAILAYFFAKFFLNYFDFIYYAYQGSAVSKFLPFFLVAIALIFFIAVLLIFIFKIFENVKLGVTFLIIYLPMSALPFIILGFPAVIIDQHFICRSNVFFFVWLLFVKVLSDLVIQNKSRDIKFPFLISTGFLTLIYIFNIFNVRPGFEIAAVESLASIITSIIIFYLFIIYIRDLKTLQKVLIILLTSCFIQILLSSFSFFYYLSVKQFANLRVEGFIRSYEIFAEYLIIHIPIILFLIRTSSKVLYQRLLTGILLLLFYVLLATQTRGAFISLAIGMGYYVVMIRKSEGFFNTLRILFICAALITIAAFILYKTIPASAHIFERFANYKIGTLDTRQYVWFKFFRYFKDRPFIGHGMVYDLRSYLFLPHSTYFSYLLTMGIVGLIAYLGLLARIIFTGMRNSILSKGRPILQEISIALNSSLIIIIVDSLKIEYLKRSNYQLIVWIFFALVVALNQILRSADSDPDMVSKK